MPIENLLRRTAPEGDCLVLQLKPKKTGYVEVYDAESRKYVLAHRLAFRLYHGREANGVVRHSCDNRACIAREHLEEGTHKQNMEDAIARGRMATGERNGSAKLTQEDVDYIRSIDTRHRNGEASEVIRRLGINRSTFNRIRNRKIWT